MATGYHTGQYRSAAPLCSGHGAMCSRRHSYRIDAPLDHCMEDNCPQKLLTYRSPTHFVLCDSKEFQDGFVDSAKPSLS